MLINEAKQQYISFPLFTNDDIVIVTDAGVLDCKFCHLLFHLVLEEKQKKCQSTHLYLNVCHYLSDSHLLCVRLLVFPLMLC